MDKTLQAADFNILDFETKDIYFGMQIIHG
jgi:hypothetical protein